MHNTSNVNTSNDNHYYESVDCESANGFLLDSNFQDDWKKSIQSVFDSVIAKNKLPEQSFHLVTNYGRDGVKETSYSICIYEPDYPLPANAVNDPERNSIVLNIKAVKNRVELLVPKELFSIVEYPSDAEVKTLKSDSLYIHVLFPVSAESLFQYIEDIVEYELANYVSKAPAFGCCSKYVECSDIGYCIHENLLYSKACSYRANLESGRIFYGKNKNID